MAENNVNFEEILVVTNQMKDLLSDNTKSVSETKEMQVRMEKDLSEKLGIVESNVNELNVKFQTLTEKQEEIENDIYKQILTGASEKTISVAKSWGFNGDVISKALYTPKTTFKAGKGWVVRDVKLPEIDPIVAEMNDFLFIYGLQKSMSLLRKGEFKSAAQCMKETETYKMFIAELKRDSELRKALATSNTGEGAEFVPTQMSSQLIDAIRMELKVAGLFRTIKMPAKAGAWTMPYNPNIDKAFLVSESTSDDATKIPAGQFATQDLTITAIKQGIRLLFSYEMDEDSIVAMMPLVIDNLKDSISRANEYAVVNGDISTTHQDSDVTSGYDCQKSFYGLRYYAGVGGTTGTVDIATLSVSVIRNIRKGMGIFGANPDKIQYITGVSAYIQMLSLDEVETVDKFGGAATIKNGTLGFIDGSGITVSPAVRQDLNATGVYDGTTTSKTIILSVYTGGFVNAEKPSGVLVENGKNIETQQNVAVATRRFTFKKLQTAPTGSKLVNVGYNLAK